MKSSVPWLRPLHPPGDVWVVRGSSLCTCRSTFPNPRRCQIFQIFIPEAHTGGPGLWHDSSRRRSRQPGFPFVGNRSPLFVLPASVIASFCCIGNNFTLRRELRTEDRGFELPRTHQPASPAVGILHDQGLRGIGHPAGAQDTCVTKDRRKLCSGGARGLGRGTACNRPMPVVTSHVPRMP